MLLSKRVLVVLGLVAFAGGCGAGGPCSAADLSAALAGAHAGDTVTVGACRVAGAFTVPTGVTLAGQSGSVLASVEGGDPVLATAGAVTLRSLAIEVDHGGVGVRASGGDLLVEDVSVEVTHGLGVGADGVGLTLRRVQVHGSVTEASAFGAPLDPSETSTFGVVGRALGDHDVLLEDVTLGGFAIAAASFTEGVLTWHGRAEGPDVEGTRGVGIALFGTLATFDSVEVAAMLAGPGMPGVGVSAAPLPTRAGGLDAGDLVVHEGEGYGLFDDGADVRLAGAAFTNMGLAGIRMQGGTLAATDLACDGNGGAGLVAVDAVSVSIERGHLDTTVERGFVTATGTIPSAEGIQIVRDPSVASAPPIDLTLTSVQLEDNARAGLLVDAAGGAVTRLALTAVTASATGTGLGAVAQNTTPPAGWDADVTRVGAALTNDPAFAGALPVLGIMMPPGLVAAAPSF